MHPMGDPLQAAAASPEEGPVLCLLALHRPLDEPLAGYLFVVVELHDAHAAAARLHRPKVQHILAQPQVRHLRAFVRGLGFKGVGFEF